MTRKHFNSIAKSIKDQIAAEPQNKKVIESYVKNNLVYVLWGYNRNFNKSRFLDACGL